jgi:hypothetical protein
MDPTSVDIHPPTPQRHRLAPAQTRPAEQQNQRAHCFLSLLSSLGKTSKFGFGEE